MGIEGFQERVLSLRKYLFWIITGILLFLCYKILKSYLIPLITAYMTAYLVRPLFERMKKKMRPMFAASICVALVALLLLLPLLWVIKKIIQEAKNPSISFSPIDSITQKLSEFPIAQHINLELVKDKLTEAIVSFIKTTLSYIPYQVLGIAIALFAMYYILLNWEFLTKQVYLFLPFREKERALEEMSSITHKILYGYALVAVTELVIASIGFTISGVKYALLYAFLIAIMAFIPGIGPGMVWIPLAAVQLISANYFTLFGVLITGLIISIGIDTFVSAKIIGNRTKINPLVLLLGILGGVPVFGIFGFIIGPIILVYTVKLIQEGLTQERKQEIKQEQGIMQSAGIPPATPTNTTSSSPKP